ncbi:MAG TPA: DUF2911 domain-containing protein [Lunatimonas sp.]|nr:DUF2911 domain-containing protein [Lunatimonas sp.]
MKKSLVSIIIAFISFTGYSQDSSEQGGLLYTLGVDTTMLGNFILRGLDFELHILVRESMTITKQKGSFFGNGELKSVSGSSYKHFYMENPQDVTTYNMYVKNDSTFTEINKGENKQVFVYKGQGIVNNMIGNSTFFLFPFWPHFSPSIGDSLVSQHLWWEKPRKYTLQRQNHQTMKAGSTLMGYLTLHLNEQGKLESIDGIGSSLNFIGSVVPHFNMDSVINTYAERVKMHGNIGPIILRDTLNTVINNVVFEIKYRRPSVRGRIIFGSVVPYNKIWRTGANQATTLQIDRPVYFGDQELPAGTYSIFTLPKEEGWTLIFNKEVGIWGTDYNAEHDVLRVPMKVENIEESVELMTIEIKPFDKGGVFQIIWDKKKASVHFDTKK